MTPEAATSSVGRSMYTQDGRELGTIRQILPFDGSTGPLFAAVSRGYLTGDPYLVPLARARIVDGGMWVPYERQSVLDGPQVTATSQLDPEDQRRLLAYYQEPDRRHGAPDDDAPDPSALSSATAPRDATAAVVRSEERLHVHLEDRPYARARLRRYVTEELQSVTVTVRREYAVLEVAAYDDPGYEQFANGEIVIGDNAVLLSEEVPEVTTTVHHLARAAIEVVTHTEDRTIAGEVRLEQVEIVTSGDLDPGTDIITRRP